MKQLSADFRRPDEEVIVAALALWCHSTQSEPDSLLMSRAISLYGNGHDSTIRLVEALKAELTN